MTLVLEDGRQVLLGAVEDLLDLAPVEVGEADGPGHKVARWQNLIPSFPWNVPGGGGRGHNPRKGRDPILQRSVEEP